MTDEIKPALTPDEWKTALHQQDWQQEQLGDPLDSAASSAAAAMCYIVDAPETRRHAAAAICLHGQPFGFIHDDVEFLRLVAGQWRELRLGEHQLSAFDSICDRIAALLPPEAHS